MKLAKPLLALAMLVAFTASAATVMAAPVTKPPVKPKTKIKIGFELVAKVPSPTVVTSAPGNKRLLFVTSRFGTIRVIQDGVLLPKPLLDISKHVQTNWIEQGLLGLAFAPDFKKTGRYYIHYTALNGDIKIDEYTVDPKDPTRTLFGSRRSVMKIPTVPTTDDHGGGNHNGGQLEFLGRYLYIAIGDGDDRGDRQNLAQNPESLRGKILRIDPRPDETASRTYSIPADNPYVGRPGRDEVFASGFRNPHSFDFFRVGDKGELQMAISDVGQARMEELNLVPFTTAWGGNFGWHYYEGTLPYDCEPEICPSGSPPPPVPNVIWPVLTYSHKVGCALIGSQYIEDDELSTIKGRLIYGDFCTNRTRTAAPRYGWITDDKRLPAYMPPGKGKQPALNGIGEDGDGHIYLFGDLGEVYRLTQTRVVIKPDKPATPGKGGKSGAGKKCKNKPAKKKKCKKKPGKGQNDKTNSE